MPAGKRKIHVHENGVVVRVWRIIRNVRSIDAFDYTHECDITLKGKRATAYLNRAGQWVAYLPYPPIKPAPRRAFDEFKETYLRSLFY